MITSAKSQLINAEYAYNKAYNQWLELMRYEQGQIAVLEAEKVIMLQQQKLQKAEEDIVSWMSRSIRKIYINDARLAWLDNIPALMLNKKKRSHLVKLAKDFDPIKYMQNMDKTS